jgi:hypothetical protein
MFVLLLNGATWTFYRSTDPNPRMADRADEPPSMRGQHRYRFGWHKLSDPNRVYRAFRPASARRTDLPRRPERRCADGRRPPRWPEREPTINIHWSRAGTSNWSAGCQVIAGRRYVNHRGQTVDCGAFAARGYAELPGKTRAAYNVLLDLVSAFASRVRHGRRGVFYGVVRARFGLEVTPNKRWRAAPRGSRARCGRVRQARRRLVATLIGAS